MAELKIPKEYKKVLDNKVKEVVRMLKGQGFDGPAIGYIMKLSEGRVSQIINEKEPQNA